MRCGILFEQGEILFVPFPFTNLSTTKKRPVLILSRTEYNKTAPDFICCGITSNLRNVDQSVSIGSGDLVSGALPKASLTRVDKIFTLEKAIAIRSFGKVRDDIMKKVKEEFYKLFRLD